MDRRFLFLIVYGLTLFSTLLVAFVCFMSEQTWVNTTLYSLTTMWIMGIISQILVQNVYLGIVRPLEEKKYDEMLAHVKSKINIDEVEEIDQVGELENAMKQAEDLQKKGG